MYQSNCLLVVTVLSLPSWKVGFSRDILINKCCSVCCCLLFLSKADGKEIYSLFSPAIAPARAIVC